MPAAEDDVAAARTGAVRQERGQRLLRTLEAKLTELAQEVADLARERKEETPGDFDSLWEAFCYHISRSQPSDFANYEDRIRALCQDVMRDLGEGRFTSQLLAICTPECDQFYQQAGFREEPSIWCLEEWASKAIYTHLIKLARDEAESGLLSYDPSLLKRIILCVRSLLPLAQTAPN